MRDLCYFLCFTNYTITGLRVFKSSIWRLFAPFSHHQQENSEFFDMLQKIRLGNMTNDIWDKLQRKHQEFDSNRPMDLLLNTTNIVGYREMADKINSLTCNTLPTAEGKFFISNAIDTVNGERWDTTLAEKTFKSRTSVQLQQAQR